jgi:hypothetical protein
MSDEHTRSSDRTQSGAGRPPAGEPEWSEDPGAYVGHEPERGTETIPGGIGPADERVSAVDSQGTGVGRPDRRGQPDEPPHGQRRADATTDDDIRRAGQTG